ncbi:MAG: hypothetical protein BAJALOKI1v1_980011 [Promethearchaeota archaeon]|nr:MAG: hypothetical protein BAJALOKI1v1_980011 [Candidatus Lokiarchaeota archaeon]
MWDSKTVQLFYEVFPNGYTGISGYDPLLDLMWFAQDQGIPYVHMTYWGGINQKPETYEEVVQMYLKNSKLGIFVTKDDGFKVFRPSFITWYEKHCDIPVPFIFKNDEIFQAFVNTNRELLKEAMKQLEVLRVVVNSARKNDLKDLGLPDELLGHPEKLSNKLLTSDDWAGKQTDWDELFDWLRVVRLDVKQWISLFEGIYKEYGPKRIAPRSSSNFISYNPKTGKGSSLTQFDKAYVKLAIRHFFEFSIKLNSMDPPRYEPLGRNDVNVIYRWAFYKSSLTYHEAMERAKRHGTQGEMSEILEMSPMDYFRSALKLEQSRSRSKSELSGTRWNYKRIVKELEDLGFKLLDTQEEVKQKKNKLKENGKSTRSLQLRVEHDCGHEMTKSLGSIIDNAYCGACAKNRKIHKNEEYCAYIMMRLVPLISDRFVLVDKEGNELLSESEREKYWDQRRSQGGFKLRNHFDSEPDPANSRKRVYEIKEGEKTIGIFEFGINSHVDVFLYLKIRDERGNFLKDKNGEDIVVKIAIERQGRQHEYSKEGVSTSLRVKNKFTFADRIEELKTDSTKFKDLKKAFKKGEERDKFEEYHKQWKNQLRRDTEKVEFFALMDDCYLLVLPPDLKSNKMVSGLIDGFRTNFPYPDAQERDVKGLAAILNDVLEAHGAESYNFEEAVTKLRLEKLNKFARLLRDGYIARESGLKKPDDQDDP